ncbi:MAG: glycosyltransferase family 39 protein [Anaerolineae bacterium]|nr:glycosyltransferase family 39 protein [Anaerolineae bacterium]
MKRAGLVLILVIFTILTVYNSVQLPIGEADDETDHYQYHRFVAQTGHPPLTEAERHEAGFKGGLAPLYYWLTAWPIALVGQDSLPDIRRVDSRPERHIPTDGLGINHVLHTLDETWPWRGQVLAWHLVRLLSLPMGWVTIIATYALAYRLQPKTPLIALMAAALVAFLPRFVISSAVINDDNLVFALTALLLLVQVIILQHEHPPTPKIMALFGALFGLSLVTKYFSLILIPEILFTLWFAFRKKTTSHVPRPTFYPLLAFLIALFLTAGLWFSFIIVRFNRIDELGLIPGLAASLGEPQITEGLVGLLSGQSVRPVAATYALPEWFGLLYRSFWFEFGWMRVFAPTWTYTLFALFSLLIIAGIIQRYGVRSKTHIPSSENKALSIQPTIHALFILHLSLFLSVVLARYILSATIDTGQGRHLYPALPVIAYYGAVGLHRLFFSTSVVRSAYLKFLPSPIVGVALIAILFIGPSLFSLQPSIFIWPYYDILPITTAPIQIPTAQRFDLEFGDGLSFRGFTVDESVAAGDALPVSLYWHAEKEAQQDYFVSLCLHAAQDRPVGCRRGQFADGRYPARAWEAGDTLIDTVFIPIPACYRLTEANYILHLDVWSLDPTSPTPTPTGSPVLTQTFSEPSINITPTDSLLTDRPQTIDLWQADQRRTTPVKTYLGQILSVITYAIQDAGPAPTFQSNHDTWQPLSQFNTPLALPCDDGPSPFATQSPFAVSPTLTNGIYQSDTDTDLPPITIANRDRVFAPITSTLSFSQTLMPLHLQLPNTEPMALSSLPLIPNPYPLPLTTQLPLTIRWQTRRWMADPLVIALKLLDKDFNVGGERVATLGDRYPNVLWVPGEVVEETYPLRIAPDAPPGLYQLEVSLLHQDESLPDGYEFLPPTDDTGPLGNALYPLTVRLLDQAHDTAPANPFEAQIGEVIELTGFGSAPNFSNSPKTVELALYWKSAAKIDTDYTVFTQLLGPDGQVWAQWDNPPQAGRYPTTAWIAQDTVVDRYTLTLNDGAPPGDYHLLVGMYNPASGERLSATVNDQPQPNNAVELTTLSLP